MFAATVYEIEKNAIGARIEKIHQPEKEEIVFVFHDVKIDGVRKGLRLVINAGTNNPKISFSHIAKETVYEPHGQGLEIHLRKTVYDYTFSSGRRWRVPEPTVRKHYAWSKECGVSNKGLEQISVSGNTFYFISLQSDQEISYIYPCKLFALDKALQEGL